MRINLWRIITKNILLDGLGSLQSNCSRIAVVVVHPTTIEKPNINGWMGHQPNQKSRNQRTTIKEPHWQRNDQRCSMKFTTTTNQTSKDASSPYPSTFANSWHVLTIPNSSFWRPIFLSLFRFAQTSQSFCKTTFRIDASIPRSHHNQVFGSDSKLEHMIEAFVSKDTHHPSLCGTILPLCHINHDSRNRHAQNPASRPLDKNLRYVLTFQHHTLYICILHLDKMKSMLSFPPLIRWVRRNLIFDTSSKTFPNDQRMGPNLPWSSPTNPFGLVIPFEASRLGLPV